MGEEVDIVITGLELDARQVETGLVRVFGIDPSEARRLLGQLPASVKRGATPELAERYLLALRSIGARVEARAVLPIEPTSLKPAPPAAAQSLAVPPPSLLGRMRESERVQRATDRAVKRFRSSEGLDDPSVDGGIDPWNPAIPKAPRVPRDLGRIKNAAPPALAESFDPGASDARELAPARVHADAQRPPPISRASGGRTAMAERVIAPAPPRAVGLAHAAKAAVRPGLSSRAVPRAVSVRPLRARALWVVAAVLVAAAVLYALGILGPAGP